MNFACVYMTKFHPACRDNFVVFAFHRTIVILFLPYLAAFRNNFHPGNRASPVVSVYMKNFHPGKRDLASFKRDLANRASPLVPYKRTVTVIRKTVARRDLAHRVVSLSGPARHPYKQPLRSLFCVSTRHLYLVSSPGAGYCVPPKHLCCILLQTHTINMHEIYGSICELKCESGFDWSTFPLTAIIFD